MEKNIALKLRLMICNDPTAMILLNNKAKANALFAKFLRRDWRDAATCSFEEFILFVKKHPLFIIKPIAGADGEGIKIIQAALSSELKNFFAWLQDNQMLAEEIIAQHEAISEFCTNSLNTIRVNTFLDIHNVARILTATGRFGRVGNFLDNPKQGGCFVEIDPMTGVIVSDAINISHERFQAHPDTSKVFKGFQYPAWKKLRATVKTMAKMIPQLRHVAWDIAINSEGEPVLVEVNVDSGVDVQLNLYQPLLDELQTYKENQMRRLGYRVNNIQNVEAAYETLTERRASALKKAMRRLIPDCKSSLNFDYKQGKTDNCDTCLCVFTAEFVKNLPQFLDKMCRAAQRQILIWCYPVDKAADKVTRWKNPFPTDFTEDFLIKTLARNNFQLAAQYPNADNPSEILYDFRRI